MTFKLIIEINNKQHSVLLVKIKITTSIYITVITIIITVLTIFWGFMFYCVSFVCLMPFWSNVGSYFVQQLQLVLKKQSNLQLIFWVGPREENLLKVSWTKVKRNMLPINKEGRKLV